MFMFVFVGRGNGYLELWFCWSLSGTQFCL
ncbi:rCG20287 [Rattus norvegicus]|uniref:RCG20287 n=1 Tax=Rattus norvegicus TaxID=10116 RepID=A6JFW6_RAT|nr:rCG20287 [Rattus norvegicus]